MLTGVFKIGKNGVSRGNSSPLSEGIYYFNKSGGSVEGQMETGKTTITYDGDNYSYYFRDNSGAYTNIVKSNSAYDDLGVCIDASDGNSNSIKEISTIGLDSTGTYRLEIEGKKYTEGTIVVSSSGKIKKSGTVTIDGTKYIIENYVVKELYDKDDKNAVGFEKAKWIGQTDAE